MPQSDQLRWGILGTARIADALVPALQGATNCALVAIASRQGETARAWAATRQVPMTFGSYDEMLASDAIDAVYIPLPNALHKEWAIRAAQHGKHVLCEKPLAANAADAQEMAAAADTAGVRLMEAFMYRFHPQTRRLHALVAEGAVGQVKNVRANFGFYLSREGDVRWSTELAGGALLDVGCYCVNIARLLLDAEPVAASARAVWTKGGVDESLAGVLEFANGALALIGASVQTGPGADQSLLVSGTRGRLSVTHPFRMGTEPTSILLNNGESPDQVTSIAVPGADEYKCMVEHFADAVLHAKPLDYTLANSIGNMRALDALRQSALTGRTIMLADQG